MGRLAMTYQIKRFNFALQMAGQGNYFADQINQFLAINPTISPVSMSVNWRFGRSRSDAMYLNLLYRGGSGPVRSWCVQFQSSANYTAEARATAFFANNPTFYPLMSTVVSRPGSVTISRRLLVIYATLSMGQVVCVPQANLGAPVASVAMAAFGVMYDPTDFNRPGIPALNLGNVAWPAGGVNMLIRTNEGSPDVCAAAGVAPACFAGSTFTAPPALSITSLCGHCLPVDLVTVSFTTASTTTGTTTTSTTTTSTTTTSTTSTTTSTTTTSTTSTTTTASTTTTTTSTTTTAACTPWEDGQSGSGPNTVIFTLPGASACAGEVTVSVAPVGQSGNGANQFVVTTNLGPVGTSACITSGSQMFSIPAGVTTITVVVSVCAAGTPGNWSVSGIG